MKNNASVWTTFWNESTGESGCLKWLILAPLQITNKVWCGHHKKKPFTTSYFEKYKLISTFKLFFIHQSKPKSDVKCYVNRSICTWTLTKSVAPKGRGGVLWACAKGAAKKWSLHFFVFFTVQCHHTWNERNIYYFDKMNKTLGETGLNKSVKTAFFGSNIFVL